MATITVRNVDDAVYERLKRDAKANHRLLEAEARARIDRSTSLPSSTMSLADAFRNVSIGPGPDYKGSVALIRAIRDER